MLLKQDSNGEFIYGQATIRILLEELLFDKYESEFTAVDEDGTLHHKDGLTFDQFVKRLTRKTRV